MMHQRDTHTGVIDRDNLFRILFMNQTWTFEAKFDFYDKKTHV